MARKAQGDAGLRDERFKEPVSTAAEFGTKRGPGLQEITTTHRVLSHLVTLSTLTNRPLGACVRMRH